MGLAVHEDLGAKLCIIPRGGHQFLVEQAHAANEAIPTFLKELSDTA